MTALNILLVEAPTLSLTYRGVDPQTRAPLTMNVGSVVTNLSKPTQSLLAAILARDLPDLGYEPTFGFFDGKSLPLGLVAVENTAIRNLFYSEYLRAIPYAGGTIDVHRLGRPLSSISDRLSSFPIMGSTSNFTFESDEVITAIADYKRVNRQGKVIVGGRDAMFRSAYYLENGADAVVLGEGDEVAARLVVALLEGRPIDFPGVAYRVGGNVVGLTQRMLRAPIRNLPLPHFFSGSEILRSDLPHRELDSYVQSQDGPLPVAVRPSLYHFFTSRGCIHACPFCTTAGMGLDRMSLDQVDWLLRYLWENGVRTLIFAEDAFLERSRMGRDMYERADARAEIIAIMQMVRSYGFAVEWANGMNIQMFLKDGEEEELDDTLLAAVCQHTLKDGNYVGTYRMSIPVERAAGDQSLKKLACPELQRLVISEIVRCCRPPSLGILTIMYPGDNRAFIEATKGALIALRSAIEQAGGGQTKSRVGLFALTPHPGSQIAHLEQYASFGIEQYPELRHYFNPVIDGRPLGGLSYEEQFWARLEILKAVDPDSFQSWINCGRYQV